MWPVWMTTVEAALVNCPGVTISPSGQRGLRKGLAQWMYPRFIHDKVLFPWFFYASMSEPIDTRLEKMNQGLGVIVGKQAKFYPINSIPADGIMDEWHGRVLCVKCGFLDGVPRAAWQDTGEEPMQLLTRWYGFAYTYPGCEVYSSPVLGTS